MTRLMMGFVVHAVALVLGTALGVVLVAIRNGWEQRQMNVASRVQRRYVKRELSLPKTMSAGATSDKPMSSKSKSRVKVPTLSPLLKTAR